MPLSASKPIRIAVTGGRGRLASLLADHFRAPDHEVTLYSREAQDGFRDHGDLEGALAEHDFLLHLAWSTLPATSERNPGAEEATDLPALEKLLLALAGRPAGSRPHFVFFSSGGAVYGNAPGRPSLETDECRPLGNYGRAKLAAEQLIARLAAAHALGCTVLRISNPYGYPVPKSRLQGVIPHALRCAVEAQPLTLWGDGHARKDFLHYTDFLSGIGEVIRRRPAGTFNLCAGESHTVREVIALAEKHTGRTIPLTPAPAPAWDVDDSRLSHERFAAATGWRPQVSLDEGIRRAAAGYAAH